MKRFWHSCTLQLETEDIAANQVLEAKHCDINPFERSNHDKQHTLYGCFF